jgi:ligand-binding sensor domain-containing protein
VHSLLSSGDSLWVSTDQGLVLITTEGSVDWSDDGITLFREADGLADENVHVALLSDTVLWVGTRDGLNVVPLGQMGDPSQWEVLRVADGLPSDSILSLAEQDGVVWIGTAEGVSHWDGGQIFLDTLTLGLEVRQIAVRADTVWAATDEGIWRREDGGWVDVSADLPVRDVMAVAVDGGGRTWIGLGSGRSGTTRCLWGEGLARWETGEWVEYRADGMASNAVMDLALDLDGTLWCCHYPGGVSHLTSDGWERYTRATTGSGLGSDWVLWGVVDSGGEKWFGTWGGGVSRLTSDGEWLRYYSGNTPLERDLVGALAVDGHDNLWVFDYGNALYGRADSDSTWWRLDLGGEERIYDMVVDGADVVWGGSYDRGLRRLDYAGTLGELADDSVTVYSLEQGLAGPNVRAVATGGSGAVWVGTTGGASLFDGQSFTTYRSASSGLLSDFVSDILVDDAGDVWFLTEAGVSVLEPGGSWRSYTSQNSGLVSGPIGDNSNGLVVDESGGYVWIGTGWGLSRLGPLEWPTPSSDLESVEVYPNPFVPSLGHQEMRFGPLPENAEVFIFAVGGELVWHSGPAAVSGGTVTWRGLNSAGKAVASGIYLYLVRLAEGGETSGRVAVVR